MKPRMQPLFSTWLIILLAHSTLIHNYSAAVDIDLQRQTDDHLKAPLPEQLHIAFGSSPDSMVVCWATYALQPAALQPAALQPYDPQVIRWRPKTSGPKTWRSVTANTTALGQYFKHRATIDGLIPGQEYWYEVGEEEAPPHRRVASSFKSQRSGFDWSPRLAFFGDLGWTNDQILPILRKEAWAGDIDAIVLFGDMVYSSIDEAENAFMRDVTKLTANGSIPFHVSPGNADSGENFTFYKENFAMPGWETADSLWHSFDLGHAHIVGISTEVFYYQNLTTQKNMLDWLNADLAAANMPSARQVRPWVVVHYHRPTYSTTSGIEFSDKFAHDIFEPLMYQYGVDLVFSGHMHNQERTWPVYQGVVMNGQTDPHDPYRNARAPVYIVSGNPSNKEGIDAFRSGYAPWTAWRSYAYGYAHLSVVNSTHLYVDIVSSSLDGKVLDDVWISKDVACVFGKYCAGGKVHGGANQLKKPLHHHKFMQKGTSAMGSQSANGWENVSRTKSRSHRKTPKDQMTALWTIYDKLNGPKWRRNSGWRRNGDPCNSPDDPWYGVSCAPVTDQLLRNLYDPDVGGITAIQLPGNWLLGNVTDLDLTPLLQANLQVLDLSDNFVYGSLPKSIFAVGGPKLHTLLLDSISQIHQPGPPDASYRLTGTIPNRIGVALPNLRFLSLQRHALSGSIPQSLGHLNCTEIATTLDTQACRFWFANNALSHAPLGLCNNTYDDIFLQGNDISCGEMPCFKCAYCSKGVDQFQPCSLPCVPCRYE